MNVDTKAMLPITDANHNFSKVTKVVNEFGSAILLKNNEPRYLVIDLTKVDEKTAEAVIKKAAATKKTSR
ncbi:MAG: type II toxin-antitoxin system Phd/YefM family antitoxin [Butyrivibrio sp.]|nr:type II toxin-antitoxin system Phd/YefM family antitoxin [Butyrivibrio sp.]